MTTWSLNLDSGPVTPQEFEKRPEGILKHVAAAFVIAIVFYVVTFMWIEHRRGKHGPWRVDFTSDARGVPAISISETELNISQIVRFVGGKANPNLSQGLNFSQAVPELPFGEMVFQDPTFLPGNVTMRLFGHRVELVPRVLFIDGKEYPWNSTNAVEVR